MRNRDNPILNNPTAEQNLITGIISAIADVTATHPLWTIKTLQQQAMKKSEIIKHLANNPKLAYNGVLANASTMIPLTTLRIFLSSEFETYLKKNEREVSSEKLLAASFMAGGISSMFGAPTELIRTIKLKQSIVAAQKNIKFNGQGFFKIGGDFLKKQGVVSLTNAATTVAMRDGSYTAAFFTGAPLLKEKLSPYVHNHTLNTMISYTIASLSASILNHPFDTLKSLQHNAVAMNYLLSQNDPTDIISVYNKIVSENGKSGLWKGYTPRGIRFLIGLAIKATCIEQLTEYWQNQNSASLRVKSP